MRVFSCFTGGVPFPRLAPGLFSVQNSPKAYTAFFHLHTFREDLIVNMLPFPLHEFESSGSHVDKAPIFDVMDYPRRHLERRRLSLGRQLASCCHAIFFYDLGELTRRVRTS